MTSVWIMRVSSMVNKILAVVGSWRFSADLHRSFNE